MKTNTSLPNHERIEDPVLRRSVDLIDSGDVLGLSLLLKENPDLIQRRVVFEGENYFRNPGLLEFVAENPVRRGTLPPNIVEVATVLLEAGPSPGSINSTLELVASGRVPRERDVQGPLIAILCRYGADPNVALPAAVAHGEFDAVQQLIELGAQPTLSTFAARGQLAECLRLLPKSDPAQRHLALALAAQYGHAAIVGALLDAGEDPDRYNPPGSHSHSTPLHQAAAGGHLAVVKLLVERGARADIQDVLWQGTPLDWARHESRTEVQSYFEKNSQ